MPNDKVERLGLIELVTEDTFSIKLEAESGAGFDYTITDIINIAEALGIDPLQALVIIASKIGNPNFGHGTPRPFHKEALGKTTNPDTR